MSPKILSQSGVSLADVYNVLGSIAGIEQLDSKEVSLVHEMGHTLFSERYQTTFRREGSTLSQSSAFNEIITNLPTAPTRLFSIAVLCDDVARLDNAVVSIRSGTGTVQDIPIWAWDQTTARSVRVQDAGGAVATMDLLIGDPASTHLPNMIGGEGQQVVDDMVDEIVFRGESNAFGAGTVSVAALYYMGFAFQGGLSSKGLPFPGW